MRTLIRSALILGALCSAPVISMADDAKKDTAADAKKDPKAPADAKKDKAADADKEKAKGW
jgi:hypothetical protein